jgi:hypothetical protein
VFIDRLSKNAVINTHLIYEYINSYLLDIYQMV